MLDIALEAVDRDGRFAIGTARHKSGMFEFEGMFVFTDDKEWQPKVGRAQYFGIYRVAGEFDDNCAWEDYCGSYSIRSDGDFVVGFIGFEDDLDLSVGNG